MIINNVNNPTFKGTLTIGDKTVKTSFPQDGVLIGYTIASFEKAGVVSTNFQDDKHNISARVGKIPFHKIVSIKGIRDNVVERIQRDLKVSATEDSFELKYTTRAIPEKDQEITWKIDKQDLKNNPAYQVYLDTFMTFAKKCFIKD